MKKIIYFIFLPSFLMSPNIWAQNDRSENLNSSLQNNQRVVRKMSQEYVETLKDYYTANAYLDGGKVAVDLSYNSFGKPLLDLTKKAKVFKLNVFANSVDAFISKGIEMSYNKFKGDRDKELQQSARDYIKSVIAKNPNIDLSDGQQLDNIIAANRIVDDKNHIIFQRRFNEVVAKNIGELQQFQKDFETKVQQIVDAESIDRDTAIEKAKDELNLNIDNATEKLKKEVAYDLALQHKEILDLQEGVAHFQKETNFAMETLNNDVKENQNTIKKNIKRIEEIEYEIVENKHDIAENRTHIKELQDLQLENRSLISENSLKISSVASVLYGEASTGGKIKLIESGAVKVKNKDETIKNLTQLSNWEEFNKDIKLGKEITKFAENLGFIDGETAKDAIKVLGALNIAGNFAMAYYSVPPNVIGMLQSANGAFALFGGGGPESDPAIMAELQKINEKLDEIKDLIVELDKKVEKIRENQIEFHKQNIQNFNKVFEKLDEIKRLVNVDLYLSLTDIKCVMLDEQDEESKRDLNKILKRIYESNGDLSLYNELLVDYPKLYNLINCIHDNTYSKNTDQIKAILKVGNNASEFDKNLNLIYSPLKEYYLSKSNNLNNLLKVGLRHNTWLKLDDENDVKIEAALKNMLNPFEVLNFGNTLVNIYPYFMLNATGGTDIADFSIWTKDELNKQSLERINTRMGLQIGHFNKFKSIIEYSIIQQNLLSGTKLLHHLYKDLGSDSDHKIAAYKAIASNFYLKFNFSNYLLHKDIFEDNYKTEIFDSIYNQSYSFEPMKQSTLGRLNGLLKTNWTFKHIKNEQNGNFYSLVLYNSVELETGEKREIILPIDIEKSKTREMVYPNVINDLLVLKQKVNQKIFELETQLQQNKL